MRLFIPSQERTLRFHSSQPIYVPSYPKVPGYPLGVFFLS
jgi:hypothetical protein